ncbi:NADPH oxidase [Trichinella pseudospiralis]
MTELIWTERRINRISQLYSIQLHRNFELLSFLSEYLKFRMSSFCCCGNWKNTDDGDINFNQLIVFNSKGTLIIVF